MRKGKRFTPSILRSWKLKRRGEGVGSDYSSPKRININGVTLLELGYTVIQPSNNEGVFRVRMLHMFAGRKSFKLTVGYSKDRSLLLEPITNHIINSLKQDAAAKR